MFKIGKFQGVIVEDNGIPGVLKSKSGLSSEVETQGAARKNGVEFQGEGGGGSQWKMRWNSREV